MRNKYRGALCLLAALCVLSGCGSREAQNISIIDAGAVSRTESAPDGEAPDAQQEQPQATSAEPVESTSAPAEAENPAESEKPVKPAAPAESEKPAESAPAHAESSAPAESEKPAEPAAPAESEKPAESAAPAETEKPDPVQTTSQTTTAQPEPDENPAVQPSYGSNSYRALNHSEVRGVWISYIELAEMLTGKTAAQFTQAIGAAFDNCAALGLNTVYVHARSHGDAYYDSDLFPQSKYVTGTLGKKADFDPLEMMTEQAHARGLSIHAWINPLRCCAVSEISGADGTIIGEWAKKRAGTYIVNVNGTYYLNPAYSEVTDLIAAGAAEIAANYDVDGVHIDDYFYPTTDASFDSAAYAESAYDTLSAFRFANCDRLVSALYGAVKGANSSALFGVSCQGSLENNYNQMYADVKKWTTADGYLDYIMPQIYYGFDNSAQPYKTCVSTWDALAVAGGKPLIVGLSVSKLGMEDTWAGAGKREWITDGDIIPRQFTYAAEQQSYGGVCLYSYRSVFAPESSVKAQVDKEIKALRALFG